ncbi:MAG: aminoacetone oxidase family FAD-binding enzyme [Lachnospiraceae bacterium]|nr:aminoacetone oxidase family FAD-binding enzyme [Lachnospiraceae bacterium]
MKEICIIGAGPAGIMASYAAADGDCRITVIERNIETLKKLCLTGNGRCNFSNEDLKSEYYNFDDKHPFAGILEEYDSEWLESLFKENGMLAIKRDGLKYPRSEKAETVKETLMNMAREKKVRFLFSKKAVSAEKIRSDGKTEKKLIIEDDRMIRSANEKKDDEGAVRYRIGFEDGEDIVCDALIIATGGKAYPNTGSDGGGYRLARALGHTVTFTYPVLTRLFTEEKDVLELAGVRFKAQVKAYIDGQKIDTEDGEIQFTDKGLSGICIFKLSRYLSKPIEEGRRCEIVIDFLSEIRKDELKRYIQGLLEKEAESGRYTGLKEAGMKVLSGMLGTQTAGLILRRCNGINGTLSKEGISEASEELAETIKEFRVRISDHDSFSNAQVTKGGVSRDEISRNMESTVSPGVFFAGEVTDVDGTCGGYNLHWAFASGYKAGKAAAEYIKGLKVD